ncbi:hypothetical protein [Pseudarthrobacter sp. NPDC080039]|uniref:mechanosensitive ion channel family protein n=1 Tax=unclassified Pseudarthrobacter TaxID=2647000 RepID=UPI00344FF346
MDLRTRYRTQEPVFRRFRDGRGVRSKLALFLVIHIVGLMIAKAISQALDKLLQKVGFDRLMEQDGVKKAL